MWFSSVSHGKLAFSGELFAYTVVPCVESNTLPIDDCKWRLLEKINIGDNEIGAYSLPKNSNYQQCL